MGNEHSKSTENGKLPKKHENGSVSGLSADLTSNGLETDVKSEAPIEQNGRHSSLNLATESTEPDFVIVESACQHAVTPAISEILEVATIQKEEVKKGKEEKVKLFGKIFKKKAEPPAEVKNVQQKEALSEDQTDVSPPVADPQPESGSSGDEAAAMIIIERRDNIHNNEDLHQKNEMSTQTDKKSAADISTQTGEDDTNTSTEAPKEETEAGGEDSLNDSVDIAEEVVEDSANEDALHKRQPVVILGNSAYENMVFRAERVEVVDSFEVDHIKNYNPGEECEMGCEETEQEITAEPEYNPKEFIIPGEIIAEEANSEPLEVSFTLPKALTDGLEAVLAALPESTDFAAANTPKPSADEVITEDNGEGTEGTTADVVLIETTEPESIAAPPEATEANGVLPPDEEPVTTVMETIAELVCEESYPTPANQDTPVGELPVPLLTQIVVQVEPANEEVTTALEDVPGISEQENFGLVTNGEPSEKCDSFSAGEILIVEAPYNYLTTTEELPEDILHFLDYQVKPESTPEVIITGENTEMGDDMIADVGPETVEETELSLVFVRDDFEMIAEAAIEALSQELELSAIIPLEPTMDVSIFLEEEVINATTFVPLCEESSTEEVPMAAKSEEPRIPEDAQTESAEKSKQIPGISEEPVKENQSPCEVDATTQLLESIVESVMEALSERHGVTENVAEEPAGEQADLPLMDTTAESKTYVSVQQDSTEEDVGPAEELSEDADKEAAASSVFTAEEPTDSSPVTAQGRESASHLKLQSKKETLETTEDEATDEIICETDNSDYVSAGTDENSQDPLNANSLAPVAECIKAVLETIVEEIIAEEVGAVECSLVPSETIAEGESKEKLENDSNVSSTDSTLDSQSVEMTENTPMTSTDMDALIVRLHSACMSVVEESAYMLAGLETYSMRHNITVTIHVDPKQQQ